jgi:hypothetical protein
MPEVGGTDLIPIVITALLGGGGAVFVGTLLKGWSDLRAGARAREREAIADIAEARAQENLRRAAAERDRDYWRSIAARYGYQLRQAGLHPEPEAPEAPSEKDRAGEWRANHRTEPAPPDWQR